MDDATGSNYPRIGDLDGRAVLIWPNRRDEAIGDNGKPYVYIAASVIVLDGAPHEKYELGQPFAIRFTSQNIVAQLEPKVGNGRATLGRVDSRNSKWGTKAYGLNPLDPGDPARARVDKGLQNYAASRTDSPTGDPFAAQPSAGASQPPF